MDSLRSHHVIFRKQNYKNVELTRNEPGETVGILRSDGGIHHVKWGGIISRDDAKIRRGQPVKLVVSRVDGYDLKEGEYLIGCVLEGRAYAVIDTEAAVVRVVVATAAERL